MKLGLFLPSQSVKLMYKLDNVFGVFFLLPIKPSSKFSLPSSLFILPDEFKNNYAQFWKDSIVIFTVITRSLKINQGGIDIFTILTLPPREVFFLEVFPYFSTKSGRFLHLDHSPSNKGYFCGFSILGCFLIGLLREYIGKLANLTTAQLTLIVKAFLFSELTPYRPELWPLELDK